MLVYQVFDFGGLNFKFGCIDYVFYLVDDEEVIFFVVVVYVVGVEEMFVVDFDEGFLGF